MSELSQKSYSQPTYGASFGVAVSSFFKKAFHFYGRASRSEYWFIILFLFLWTLVLKLVEKFIGGGVADTLQVIVGLVLLIPFITLTGRRLQDAGMPGWLVALGIIPVINLVIFFWLPALPTRLDKHVY